MRALLRDARACQDNPDDAVGTVTLEPGEAASFVLHGAILDFERRLFPHTGEFEYKFGSTCLARLTRNVVCGCGAYAHVLMFGLFFVLVLPSDQVSRRGTLD